MRYSVAEALRPIGGDLAGALAPDAIAGPAGTPGTTGGRVLDPAATAHPFVLQILHGNTACAYLPRPAGPARSASADCQAHARLPLAVCQALLRGVTAAARAPVVTVGPWTVDRPGFRVRGVTVVTTLRDAEAYPPAAVAGLYRQRWRVETDLRHLKATLGMDALRCRTEAGVLEELAMFAVVYDLARVVMAEAGERQGVPVERISFVDALRWLATAPPGAPLPRLVVNPDRPDRVEPRCQKRRGKSYPYMIHPRPVLWQRLIDAGPAAYLHAIQVPRQMRGLPPVTATVAPAM